MTFTPVVIGSGLVAYNFLNKTREVQANTLENSAQTQRDIAAVRDDLPKITTSQDLMDNRQMLRIVLSAFGLEEDINNKAFVQGVLDSELSDPRSLANRLSDKRYLSLARTFGFNSADGPQALNTASEEANALSEALSQVQSASDLLNNRSLLRETLAAYGLPESDVDNTFFLEQVFASDTGDASSFANQLVAPGYAALAADLDFPSKSDNKDTLIGFAKLVQDSGATFSTAEDLLDTPEVLEASLRLFGLDGEEVDDAFLTDVLESDLTDDESFANSETNELWAAFSNAFAIGERIARPDSFAAETSPLERLVEAIGIRTDAFTSTEDFTAQVNISLATHQFFDLPTDTDEFNRIRLVLDSDVNSPTSLRNLLADPRYELLASAVDVQTPETEYRIPSGFVDSLLDSYLTRQFEQRVGEVDPDMRLALGFERELTDLLGNAASNTARWFGVMASEPLRQVFEKALNLPSSFGALDLDRQLSDFLDRAEARYGTADLTVLAEPENAQTVVRDFLSNTSISAGGTGGGVNAASVILGSIQAQF